MYTIKLMLNAILFEWRSRRGFMNLLSILRIAGALAVYLRFQYFATEHWNAIYPVWVVYFLYSWVVLLFVLLHNRDLHFSPTAHYVYYLLLIGVDVLVISYFLNATFLPPVEDTNSELYLFYLLPLITTAFYIQRSDAALGISAAIVLTYFLTLRGMSPDKPHLFEVWAARAFILLVATWFVRVLVKFHHLHEERVTSPTSVRNELEEMLKELQQSVAYDTISVQILYRTHLQIVCCLGFENPKDIYQIEFPSDDRKYPNHLVISSKRCIVADPKDYPSFHESQYFADHIATWMGVPLISPDTGECFGLISVDSQTPNAYATLDQSKAQWFSAKVSSFLVAAGLGPAALTQSTKRENLLELLRQWAQLLPRKTSDWEDDAQAANFLANFGKDLFHVEDCSIYFLRHRFDELGDTIRVLHLVASSTIPPEVFSKNESLVTGHHGDGLTGQAVHRNKTLNLGAHQIKRSPYRGKFTDHLQYMFSKSSRQIMIVPLRDARGRAKGAIKIENRMGRTSEQPFSPVEEHSFEIFAAMVTLLLENTRQRNFIERQRQSVHNLRGIMPHGIVPLEDLLQDIQHHKKIRRASIQKKVEDALNPFVYSKSILDSILAESGETLLLENEGLIPALHHFIDSLKTMPMLKPSCERIAFHMEDARDHLPFRVRVAFYNVAREAILNLVRHSGIEMQENGMGLVKFYVDGTTYHLLIQDNGKGFDLKQKLAHRHSFGLNDILEFQKNVIKNLCQKADLVLSSEPGKGTLIHLSATL